MSLYVSEFDLKLIHLPGTKMIQSDALSRRPDLCPEEDHDNEDIIMLPDALFANLIDIDLQEKIAASKDLDTDAAEAVKTLMENGPVRLQNDLGDWTIEQFNGANILFYQGKNYIPKDQDLQRDIVKKFHDPQTAGHPGELETFNAVRQHYWGPGM